MIELLDISFAYAPAQPLFQGLNWRIAPGERWAVLGASGAGKSTLLHLLAVLQSPQTGRVLVDGQVLHQPIPDNGLILQEHELLPWATVRENAALGLRIHPARVPRGERDARVEHWLQRLGIRDVAGRYPHQLSGGQRQRCALARTLALNARRLLMDEPFSALDVHTRRDLQTLTLELCREGGLTLVLVTHDIPEALRLGRRILVLGRDRPLAPRVVENPATDGPGPAPDALAAQLREALA